MQSIFPWAEKNRNSLLFVYADDDKNKVTKLEMMDVLRKLGVRNAHLGDLREIESKELEQFHVRKIYVQKFFKRLSSQALPRPAVPPQSVSTVESLLKYLRMQHAQRALQFYDLNRLSELSESSLVGKGLKIVEARVRSSSSVLVSHSHLLEKNNSRTIKHNRYFKEHFV